jgi:hypothetical protein
MIKQAILFFKSFEQPKLHFFFGFAYKKNYYLFVNYYNLNINIKYYLFIYKNNYYQQSLYQIVEDAYALEEEKRV